ncbi:MAG: ABC transporter substrate binding protein [Syntrophales bacterium]|nr:ABC transporter substrate binding protein [Syntrophales bacterium]
MNRFAKNAVRLVFFFLTAFFMLFAVSFAEPAGVIIVGDTQLKPVLDIISGIQATLAVQFKVYSPESVKGRLRDVAEKEKALLVIALGREAVDEALRLPPSIAVIYDLVIIPPIVNRANMTGFYMATPVERYIEVIENYLPSIRRIAVVGSSNLVKILGVADSPQVVSYRVKNSLEFVSTIKRLDGFDAILLLPDSAVLTATAVEEVYLLSFKKGIPILGVSEKYVKQGALFSLVLEPSDVGRQIGERASRAMAGGVDLGSFPPSPSRKFAMFINTDTARRMMIRVPPELLRKAKRAYP